MFMIHGKGQNINKSLQTVVFNTHRWLWGIQVFSVGKNCWCSEWNSDELKLEVESEYVTALLQISWYTLTKEMLLVYEQTKCFLEMKTVTAEDAEQMLKWQ